MRTPTIIIIALVAAAGCARFDAVMKKRAAAAEAEAAEPTSGPCVDELFNQCVDIGEPHEMGYGVPVDRERARKYYARGCEHDFANACFRLARLDEELLSSKEASAKDVEPAIAALKKACGLDDLRACERVARAYYDGAGGRSNYRKAVDYARDGCAKREPLPEDAKLEHRIGQVASCALLARFYHSGKGVGRDPAQARENALFACERVDIQPAGGCEILGLYHRREGAAPEELQNAAAAWDHGCQGREGGSCCRLAELLEGGAEVTTEKEPFWYRSQATVVEYECSQAPAEQGVPEVPD